MQFLSRDKKFLLSKLIKMDGGLDMLLGSLNLRGTFHQTI